MEQQGVTLLEHLYELRTRLIKSFGAIALGAVAAYHYSEQLFTIIRAPIQKYLTASVGGLIFTAPMDKFLAHLKVAGLGGLLIASPFWIYQIWKFVAPGLYEKEKKAAASFVFFGTLLFLTGVSFVYFLVYPMAFDFLFSFGGDTDKPFITISSYLDFFIGTTLMFGLAFELPLILVLLGMMNIITHQYLKEMRRYAVVLLSLVAAVITPPDIISMIMMLVPLLALYEVAVILVGLVERKRNLVRT